LTAGGEGGDVQLVDRLAVAKACEMLPATIRRHRSQV